jgi:hypothetical protein
MKKSLFLSLAFAVAVVFHPPTVAKADYSDVDPNIYTTGVTQYGDDYVILKDYSQFTYSYGDGKTATLNDKATGTDQIMAFIREVITNKRIPGLTKDPTPQECLPANGRLYYPLNDNGNGYSSNKMESPADEIRTPYSKNKFKDYDIEWDDYTPEYNGMTAILVKMRSDCKKEPYSGSTSSKEFIKKYVQSVRMMENCLRVEGDNPGWLFSTKTPLNKFYIMTKGKMRGNYNKPFRWMFEQLSPADDVHPIPENTYEEMLNGQEFYINHDCRGVISKYHPVNMGKDDEDEEFAASILVFIPDKRFAALEEDQLTDAEKVKGVKKNETVEVKVGDDWTRNSDTSYIYYNEKYAPYFLFNNVYLTVEDVIDSETKEEDGEEYAQVLLSWNSEIDKVLHSTNEIEKYRLYRINEDGEKELIDISDLIVYEDGVETELRESDGTIRHINGAMKIYVKEKKEKHGRQVEYLVEGSVAGANIAYVESNTSLASIPGYDIAERCELILVENPSSVFIHKDNATTSEEADYNHYRHAFGLTNDADYDHPLRALHLTRTDEENEDRYFALMRTDSLEDVENDKGEWEEVERLTITRIAEEGDYYVYYGQTSGTNYEGEAFINEEKAYFRSLIADGQDAVADIATAQGTVWFECVFDAFTKDNLHPNKYYYQLASNIPVREEGTNVTAESRVIRIDIPHTYTTASLTPYTKDQIMDDYNHTLPLSHKEIDYFVKQDVMVRKYELDLYHNRDEDAHNLATVKRAQDGTHNKSERDATEYIDPESGDTMFTYSYINEEEDVTDSLQNFELHRGFGDKIDEQYAHTVVVIQDVNKNTYGTGRAYLGKKPSFKGEIFDVDRIYNNTYQVKAHITKCPSKVDDHADASDHITAEQYYRATLVTDFNPYLVNVYDTTFWDRDNAIVQTTPNEFSELMAITDGDTTWDADMSYNITPDWTVGTFVESEWDEKYPTIEEKKAITTPVDGESYPLIVSLKVRNYARLASSTDDNPLYAVSEEYLSIGTNGSTIVTGIDNPELSAEVPVKIYGVNGTLLRSYMGDRNAAADLHDLPAGVYIVRIEDKAYKMIK